MTDLTYAECESIDLVLPLHPSSPPARPCIPNVEWVLSEKGTELRFEFKNCTVVKAIGAVIDVVSMYGVVPECMKFNAKLKAPVEKVMVTGKVSAE